MTGNDYSVIFRIFLDYYESKKTIDAVGRAFDETVRRMVRDEKIPEWSARQLVFNLLPEHYKSSIGINYCKG